MRRAPLLALAVGSALLLAGGCASSTSDAASAPPEYRPVALSGGDRVGARIFRDSPEFVLAQTTTDPDIASVDTDAE